MTTQVLFVQGAGADTFEQWDNRLVASLRQHLGGGFVVRYPPMPDPGDPKPAAWVQALREEFAHLRDGDVLVGHSIGGAMLIHALTTQPPPFRPGALVLLASPFFGRGGWEGEGMAFLPNLPMHLPRALPVRLYHGTRDDTVPASHLTLFAGAIPSAVATSVPGADHQFNDDLAIVAEDIRRLDLG